MLILYILVFIDDNTLSTTILLLVSIVMLSGNIGYINIDNVPYWVSYSASCNHNGT